MKTDVETHDVTGDMFAFQSLVEQHRDDVYSFALWMTQSETQAAEIAQESFLSACLRLNELRDEAEFGAWVRWMAARYASIRLRLQQPAKTTHEELKSTKVHASTCPARHPNADWSENADQEVLSTALRRAIEDAIDALPQSHRAVFLFKDVAGLSYEQIASLSGESIPAVKWRLHQARLSLRETIDRFYSER